MERIVMKRLITYIFTLAVLASCSFLDPLPNGKITDENYLQYATVIKGYIFKAYNNLPNSYYSEEYVGLDFSSDDVVSTVEDDPMRQFSIGNAQMSTYALSDMWTRDYESINYVNLFLEDDLGKNTRYIVNKEDNARLQNYLQGDAYGLRAWYLYDLLKMFGGKDARGNLLGVPMFTSPVDLNNFDAESVVRPSYDDCVKQIISDCDNALKYLPEANRDFVVAPTAAGIDGAARYRGLDQIAIKALKARVYLTWASPAFNPSNDKSRWENAAKCAAEVMAYKLNVEGARSNGFNPVNAFYFTNHNDPEVIWTSNWVSHPFETAFYPLGFGGTASVNPSQEFVNAFGDSQGYPINHARSNYDATKPYENRDPRFYANIYTNNSKVLRGGDASDVMYTFEIAEDGKDAPGLVNTSKTGYNAKKYIFNLWNPNDKTIQSSDVSIFFLRWTQMCLTFAEAANHVVGPTASLSGFSAKEALAYIRNRNTQDGNPGVGVNGDPYLEECAAAGEKTFDALVKNEWRIETFLEGNRFWDLRRWGATASELSAPVSGVRISGSKYSVQEIERKSYASPWMPIPYLEIRKCPGIVQNAGWESWK